MQTSSISVMASDSLYSLYVSGCLFASFIVWLVWSFCGRKFSYRTTGIGIGLCIFCVAAVISGFAAADKRLAINNIVSKADQIASPLRQLPATLLHGDYWPGNLIAYPNGTLYALDWQMAAIGPGVLDLMIFIQESRWWFEPMPVSVGEIVGRYKHNLSKLNGCEWSNSEWEMLLDHALLWTFLSNWIEVLGRAPNSIIQVHKEHLESVWLEPIRRAAFRRLSI